MPFYENIKGIAGEFGQSLRTPAAKAEQDRKTACESQGGTWDNQAKRCIFPPKQTEAQQPVETPKIEPTKPEIFRDEKGNVTGVKLPSGESYVGVGPEQVGAILKQFEQAPPEVQAQGIQPVGTQQRQFEQQLQAQQLVGQIGQFGQLPVSPTGLDVGEAATQGIVGAIPRALGLAATGAGVGLVGGTAVAPGIGTASGAAIGAAAGFVSGIASSMISNFRSQRTDTTNAQKRVLDEGKQTLNDWVTLAATDPANRHFYISSFNQQLALIDQAYRQMKLDTQRDVAKFETALPDLAEFEAFYAAQGERDFLIADMQNSLLQPSTTEYKMIELAQRRSKINENTTNS